MLELLITGHNVIDINEDGEGLCFSCQKFTLHFAQRNGNFFHPNSTQGKKLVIGPESCSTSLWKCTSAETLRVERKRFLTH